MSALYFDSLRKKFKVQVRQDVGLSYSTAVIRLNSEMLYVYRQHLIRSDGFDLDIHSKFWSVAFFQESEAQAHLIRLGESIPVRGKQILMIPPYSFLKWHLAAGPVQWEAFLLRNQPTLSITEPMLFDLSAIPKCPMDATELVSLIKSLPAGRLVGFKNKNSLVAEKIKHRLDDRFPEFPNMSVLAKEVALQLPSLDREFHRTYGLSPREYNVRQRTLGTYLAALFSNKKSIKSVASEMGFYHMGNFHKQCRRYLNAKPSELKTHPLDPGFSPKA